MIALFLNSPFLLSLILFYFTLLLPRPAFCSHCSLSGGLRSSSSHLSPPSFQLPPIPSFFSRIRFFRQHLPANTCIHSYEQQLLGIVLPLLAHFVNHCTDGLQCPQGRGPRDHFTGLFSLSYPKNRP